MKFRRAIYLLLVLLCSPIYGRAQQQYLNMEQVFNVADMLPQDLRVEGSSQGMAIYGRYAFLMHDKGQCVIIDIKRGRFLSTYVMEGNTGHCNNASFGRERAGKESRFPLLYVTECRGNRACYVNDVSLEGSSLVQTIYYDGEDISGPADWFVDRWKGDIWLYCTKGRVRMLKKFRLPRLSASDENGEVHLTLADQIEEVVAGDIGIPQGSMIRRNKVYLPDGVPSRDRNLHVKDLKSGKVATFDLNHIAIEPEGVASKGRRLYMSFHTPRSPRQNIIYRFKIERHRD